MLLFQCFAGPDLETAMSADDRDQKNADGTEVDLTKDITVAGTAKHRLSVTCAEKRKGIEIKIETDTGMEIDQLNSCIYFRN